MRIRIMNIVVKILGFDADDVVKAIAESNGWDGKNSGVDRYGLR